LEPVYGICWGCNQNATLQKPFLLCSICSDENLHTSRIDDGSIRWEGSILKVINQPTWKLRDIRLKKQLELDDILRIEDVVGKSEKFWLTSDAVVMDIRKIDDELERRS
jgi:hypothetical protein